MWRFVFKCSAQKAGIGLLMFGTQIRFFTNVIDSLFELKGNSIHV